MESQWDCSICYSLLLDPVVGERTPSFLGFLLGCSLGSCTRPCSACDAAFNAQSQHATSPLAPAGAGSFISSKAPSAVTVSPTQANRLARIKNISLFNSLFYQGKIGAWQARKMSWHRQPSGPCVSLRMDRSSAAGRPELSSTGTVGTTMACAHLHKFACRPRTATQQLCMHTYALCLLAGKCGHDFCKDCLLNWTETCTSRGKAVACPLCRTELAETKEGVKSLGKRL